MKFRLKAASGPLTGQTFDLGVDVTHIGSDATMDVVLEGIGEQHAKILSQDGGLVIEPMAGSKVFLNGEAIDGPQGLTSGDEIRLENLRLVLQAPGLKPQRILDTAKPKPSRPWFRIGVGVAVAAAIAVAYVYWQHPEVFEGLLMHFQRNPETP